MKHKSQLLKVLLGATALSVFTVGNAHAAGTAAGTSVENIFTLDYQVGGVDQTQITNDGTGGNDAPTAFTVDRLIDLNVDSTTDTNVTPGSTDQALVFTLTNEGNDTQQYDLALLDESLNDFDATGLEIWYEDPTSPGTYIQFTGSNYPELTADQTINVEIRGDIPAGATDGQQDGISLLATTLDTSGVLVAEDTDGNDADLTVVENVFADDPASAEASSGDDTANPDGVESGTAVFNVVTADLTGAKAVSVYSEDGSGCTTIPGSPTAGAHPVPGACVEYVITVVNNGSADATAIVINDVLDDNLEFITAVSGGEFSAGAFGTPALPAANTDCTGGACEVNFENGVLPAPVSPATSTTGTITIRALVK